MTPENLTLQPRKINMSHSLTSNSPEPAKTLCLALQPANSADHPLDPFYCDLPKSHAYDHAAHRDGKRIASWPQDKTSDTKSDAKYWDLANRFASIVNTLNQVDGPNAMTDDDAADIISALRENGITIHG